MSSDRESVLRQQADQSDTTVALNPLTGIHVDDIRDIARTTAAQTLRQPILVGKHLVAHGKKLAKILSGKSNYKLAPRDRRFSHSKWSNGGYYTGLLQSYLALDESLQQLLEELDLAEVDKLRAEFLSRLVIESISPSNNILSNPEALEKAIETKGESLVKGVRNLIHDLQNNHAIPRQVDDNGFVVGENLATTKGSVVFKNEVLELIQYTPTTAKVYRRPVVFVSAMINKFYALDLTPDRSLVKYSVDQGVQSFVVSWANPQQEHSHWGVELYAKAVLEALKAVKSITKSKDIHLFSLCSGAMSMSVLAAYLAARGDESIHSMTVGVCMLETNNTDMEMSAFANDKVYEAVKKRSAKAGILHGHQLATSMLWMRPQDLIWSNVVNNYLLGNEPPSFDLLFWNNDWTNLPAQLHADVVDMFSTGCLTKPGEMVVHGEALDLGKVTCDKMFVGGLSDHITPWKTCFRSATYFGGNNEFLLSNSGHIQTLLNSPTKRNVSYFTNDTNPGGDADQWLDEAELQQGSWWEYWGSWLTARLGQQKNAPKNLGNKQYPATDAAPGTYVFQTSQ